MIFEKYKEFGLSPRLRSAKKNDSYAGLGSDLDRFNWSAVFLQLPASALIITEKLDVVCANGAFSRLVSDQPDVFSDASLISLAEFHGVPELVRQAMVLSTHVQSTMQWLLPRRTQPLSVSVTASKIPGLKHGALTYLLLSVEDLGERNRVAHDLHIAQEAAQIGSWYTHFDGKFHFTPTGYKIFGLPENKPVCFEDLIERVHPDDRAQAELRWAQGLRDGSYNCEIRITAYNQIRWVAKRVSFDLDPSGKPLRGYGIVQDVTDQRLADARTRRLADFDGLTGLLNRRRGIELAKDAVEKISPGQWSVAICFIDLNRFKEINDIHGHAIGDLVLTEVARRYSRVVGEGSILSRLGGDEFLVVHRFSSEKAPGEMLNKLVGAISDPLQIGGMKLKVGASIGVAMSSGQSDDVNVLLQHADIAMYDAKANNVHYQLFNSDMGKRHIREVALASKLRIAIDDSHLQVYFQPKVSLVKGGLSGVEALARWYDSEYGWVSPAEFVGIAESRGFVSLLGEWALSAVCQHWRAWRDDGLALPPSISVNLSARQLMDEEFPDRALALVRRHNVPPEVIDFEVTETALLYDPEKAQRAATRLVGYGFCLSIDDFGTGYSSLSRLHKLSVSQLKIDMSFVQGMLASPAGLSIVTAVIEMAKALNLRTVAEGVETKEQHEMLCQLGCDEAQGYFYGRPMAVGTFVSAWLGGKAMQSSLELNDLE